VNGNGSHRLGRAVVGYLTRVVLVMIVLVISGERHAEREHQSARDTTIGPSEPIGQRGATDGG